MHSVGCLSGLFFNVLTSDGCCPLCIVVEAIVSRPVRATVARGPVGGTTTHQLRGIKSQQFLSVHYLKIFSLKYTFFTFAIPPCVWFSAVAPFEVVTTQTKEHLLQ